MLTPVSNWPTLKTVQIWTRPPSSHPPRGISLCPLVLASMQLNWQHLRQHSVRVHQARNVGQALAIRIRKLQLVHKTKWVPKISLTIQHPCLDLSRFLTQASSTHFKLFKSLPLPSQLRTGKARGWVWDSLIQNPKYNTMAAKFRVRKGKVMLICECGLNRCKGRFCSSL